MQVRILGPIEIAGPEGSWEVAGLRRKAVLAALAVEPGRVVSTERLAAAVWDGQAPTTVRNTLQAHISYLRRAFGDPDVIRAVSPGYLLRLGVEATDAEAAGRLIQEAAQEEDPARRTARAQEAVALWRGPALADVADLAAFHGWAQRLDELRVRARRLLIDCLLTLGRVNQAVQDAQELWYDYRLDEESAGLLMRALYQAGRQVDALAVYREISSALREELGLDPGAALRELEAAILRQDAGVLRRQSALEPPPEPSPEQEREPERELSPAPAQLPGSVYIVGRDPQIRTLDALAERVADADPSSPAAIAAITGTAGIGKTALAVHWARRVAGAFPDGQLHVDLHGSGLGETAVDIGQTLRAFLVALGVPKERIPSDPAARAALFRSVSADRRVLIVLDNVRDAEQIRPLLPGAPGCLVLVTSRSPLASLVACEGATAIPLDLLAPRDAYALLERRLGPERLAAEPGPFRGVVESCEGLPLAISLAGAWAATHPRLSIAEYAVDLAKIATTFEALDGGDHRTDLRAVFSWSYRALSDEAARLLRFQSLRPGPGISVPAAASLVAASRGRAAELVAELTGTALLTQYAPGRYGAHDLLCRFAYQESMAFDPQVVRAEAVLRLMEHYLYSAVAAARWLDPCGGEAKLPDPRPGVVPECFESRAAAAAWLRAEAAELAATVERAVEDGVDTGAWSLVSAWIPGLRELLDVEAA
ncbi:DNA-binding SARP family transcriptional activator [Catenulispora sp. GAS73]|uniref:AfsR/SARP family transcriptional regulator n=1 Tax=Catenulispora sp. GAS73 TaxID=3156269 RepID=UPI0035118043